MCEHCEERKQKVAENIERICKVCRAIEDGFSRENMVALLDGLALKREGLMSPDVLMMVIATLYNSNQQLMADNANLRDSLETVHATPSPAPQEISGGMSLPDVLRLVESIANTFENSHMRAMEGANSQIRELKNRADLNKVGA